MSSKSCTLFPFRFLKYLRGVCSALLATSQSDVRRHLKVVHPTSSCAIENFAQFHLGLVSEMKKLWLPTARLPGGLPPLIRFKCASCKKSYNLKQNFNKHVRVSSGRCTGSRPIETPYHQLPCGQFAEQVQVSNPTKGTVYSPDILDGVNGSFRTIETTMLAYVRDDEDPGTFVSLFGPLMQKSKKSFESIMCDFINRYEQPPASHEQSLRKIPMSLSNNPDPDYYLENSFRWFLSSNQKPRWFSRKILATFSTL